MICYVCDAEGTYADARNPLCDACAPAAAHVVWMMTGLSIDAMFTGLAVCKGAGCGWAFESDDPRALDAAVTAHWRAVIEERSQHDGV